jgi:hypothetical protein
MCTLHWAEVQRGVCPEEDESIQTHLFHRAFDQPGVIDACRAGRVDEDVVVARGLNRAELMRDEPPLPASYRENNVSGGAEVREDETSGPRGEAIGNCFSDFSEVICENRSGREIARHHFPRSERQLQVFRAVLNPRDDTSIHSLRIDHDQCQLALSTSLQLGQRRENIVKL